jgi:hypothetical protein
MSKKKTTKLSAESTHKDLIKQNRSQAELSANQDTELQQVTPSKSKKIISFLLFSVYFLFLSAVLAFLSYQFYKKFTEPHSLARFLPANDTLAFVETDLDDSNSQFTNLHELLEKNTPFDRNIFDVLISDLTSLSFKNQIKPILKRRIGAALLHDSRNSYKTAPQIFYFLEFQNSAQAMELLNKSGFKTEADSIISYRERDFEVYEFSLSHDFKITFIGNLMVVAPNREAMSFFLDSFYSGETNLLNIPIFQKPRNNVPSNNIAFAYINLQLLQRSMTDYPRWYALNLPFSELQSFIDSNSISQAIAITASKTSLESHIFTYTERLPDQSKNRSHKAFRQLTSFNPKDLVMFVNSWDTAFELSKNDSASKADNSAQYQSLSLYLQEIFGADFQLDKYLNLFALESSFLLRDGKNGLEFALVTEFDDVKQQKIALELVEKFKARAGIFAPIEKEVALSDGTLVKELVRNPEESKIVSDFIGKYEIKTVFLPGQDWNFNFATKSLGKNEFILFGNNKEFISDLLKDLSQSDLKENLSNEINPRLSNYAKSANEYGFFDLMPILKNTFTQEIPFKKLKLYFAINRFNDGSYGFLSWDFSF